MDSAISPHGKPQATSHFDAVRPEEARKLSQIRTLGALSTVVHSPASATISDWALAFLAALLLLNLLLLLFRLLMPRPL